MGRSIPSVRSSCGFTIWEPSQSHTVHLDTIAPGQSETDGSQARMPPQVMHDQDRRHICAQALDNQRCMKCGQTVLPTMPAGISAFATAYRPCSRAYSCPLACCSPGASATQPLELPHQAALAPNVSALQHDGLRHHSSRLTIAQIAASLSKNNPDIIATRAQHGVAQAQVLQAGLLPNPQVTGAYLPLVAGVGTTSAWNAGIGEDIRNLITLSSSRRAAKASAAQIDAQILWQEWQITRPSPAAVH